MPEIHKGKRCGILLLLFACGMMLFSCSNTADTPENETETVPYTDEDLAAELGISVNFPDLHPEESEETDPVNDSGTNVPETDVPEENPAIQMKVYDHMDLYHTPDAATPEKSLTDGEIVMLKEIPGSEWTEVYYVAGPLMGYTKNGFMHAVLPGSEVYAELPVEYGMARTNANTYVPAYSHLVDVRKYFRVFSSTSDLSGVADFTKYDLVVSMKLSTAETTIGKPFYNSNICMVQYDLLPMIKKAVDLFAKDGYRIVIYDAYRPTSVQQRWFDVVKVHKWVANPAIGMGGVHDRGTALDISLIDMNGNLLEMPTPMHTFTEESARNSTTMTETARNNMNYMLNVMLQCGFTYINSEWWHFQDVDTQYYLPTDHPIDEIPLVPSEPTEIGTVSQ